jgi:hypothetical protein
MDNSFAERLNSLQNEYYETHKKNTIFKNNQKRECATLVLNSVSLEELLNKTAYILTDTNRVYIDYIVLKTFAVEDTYPKIINHICTLFKQCIEKYNNYECHVNLLSNTITACERHKSIFNYLIEDCKRNNNVYITHLSKFCIYNSPSTISTIINMLLPIMSPIIKAKMTLFDKIESPTRIQYLHQNI